MPNQYTNFDEKEKREKRGKQFSVSLNPELTASWEKMASQVRMKEADMFRELVPILSKRVNEFYERYPDVTRLGLYRVLDAYYNASKVALEQEWRREDEVMLAYQAAKRKDGGRVNYELNNSHRLALRFHMEAWARGLSVVDLLGEYAKAKVETRKAFQLEDDSYLADDPEPANEPPPPEAAKVAAPPARLEWWETKRVYVVLGAVVLVLLAVGALVGFIVARVVL